MYDELKNLVKRFVDTNNVTTMIVGDSNWYKLQKTISDLYGPAVNNSEFWGDVFLDICYDLNIEVSYND